ncbi:polyprenyl synthetase family protein [Legionella fallonii]|uniref:(2E,6E)-farnesyl diphosphate synthase n=1 Tax=Legionella fallonii LLAP-10 TaxID=1212491 RepID=A0A098G3Q6_9GAMM|nr:farnesyl diphosphate synthase [Legionella fallonii]CEG56634.1 (2E,6E)-farnesyl diphosphate synthase [Legionella fallonii LLAP-10]
MNILEYIKQCQTRVNNALTLYLPNKQDAPQLLHEAMCYSVLNGGKRLRASFVYALGDALGADGATVLDKVACSIEIIHAFTLIHDDLPDLDNDDLRRGIPTCHKAFGSATAILAGDALQSLAFELLAFQDHQNDIKPENKLKMIYVLAKAIGSYGLAAGEELDLKSINQEITLSELDTMYQLKTGCLLAASMQLAALAANYDDPLFLNTLNELGNIIGITYQIHDDIIGIECDSKALGKTSAIDLINNKPIYPSLIGMEKAKLYESRYLDKAMEYLKYFEFDCEELRELIIFIVSRRY